MTVLGLLLSITGTLCAQENDHAEMTTATYKALSPDDRLFAPWPYSFGIDYTITLGRGNQLRIELANGSPRAMKLKWTDRARGADLR